MDELPSSQTLAASSPPSEKSSHTIILADLPPVYILPAHFQENELHEAEDILQAKGAQLTTDLTRAKIFIGKVGTKRRAEFELRSRQFKTEEITIPKALPKDVHSNTDLQKDSITGDSRSSDTELIVLDDSATEDEAEPLGLKNANIGATASQRKHARTPDEESTTEGESEDEPPGKKQRTNRGSMNQHQGHQSHKGVTFAGYETEDEALPAVQKADPVQIVSSPPAGPMEAHDALAIRIFTYDGPDDVIWVIKLDWLNASIAAGHFLPLGDFLVYQAKVLSRPSKSTQSNQASISSHASSVMPVSRSAMAAPPVPDRNILERAKEDAIGAPRRTTGYRPYKPSLPFMSRGSRRFEDRSFAPQSQRHPHHMLSATQLLQQTTSEYEAEKDNEIPDPPEWVKEGWIYACQRFAPPNPPNEAFIEELKKIRKARLLSSDEIGVRAYSTSIASLASYPYHLISPREILALPGCDVKIANLWVEFKNSGHVQAADDAENDETMQVLRLFYEIWGVGATTAREFHFQKGWRDLDDIVEYGWDTLSRVQQIGVKYYDEFLDGIPRAEVEQIADVVRAHAIKVRDEHVTVTTVGGYRRGKEKSGDVDMIVSHPDLDATANIVKDIVMSLEEEGWITHTLLLSLKATSRGQATLPYRTSKQAGQGFDSLDKALVVWQDPNWPTKEADLAANPNAKNPNVHRRVDIIISAWRTVGCAVMGWSGGTTFQRDLRRYAKHKKGWKFDSSGIRSRETGLVVEIEGPNGVNGTPEDAEKRVFEGLGLEYVPPEQRCTG